MRRFLLILMLLIYCGGGNALASSVSVKAVEYASQEKWTQAKALAEKSGDPIVKDLYEWFYLINSKNPARSFEQIERFILKYPDWPKQQALQVAAEDKLKDSTPDAEILKFFAVKSPLTTHAAILYGGALRRAAQESTLKAFAKKFWYEADFAVGNQTKFYKSFKHYLDQSDHEKRIDRLLWDGQWRGAEAMLPFVSKDLRLLATARMTLARNRNGPDRAVRKVPEYLKNDIGLMYERIRWRRKKDLDSGAEKLLLSLPTNQIFPAAVWKERHIMARRFIEDKEYQRAYDLTSRHGQETGFAFAQAHWISGWLALRFLNAPWKAFEHFNALYNGVKTPISKARGAYWGGRASLALGDQEVAKAWFAAAARYSMTFYGQLGNTELRKLDSEYQVELLPEGRDVTSAGRSTFRQHPLTRAVKLLAQARAKNTTDLFFKALGDEAKTPEAFVLISQLAEELGYLQASVRMAKKALNKNIMMLESGYPLIPGRYPDNGVERALVHAIIRQESQFAVRAQSHAGALGYMQLLPGTARETAGKLGIRYSKTKLTRDKRYNVNLGSRYLSQMLNKYDGSYVLAVAAYNAGPGRVDRIIRENGDPRLYDRNDRGTTTLDMVDWIELIPIYETRNYVQRVLENMHVYRLRELPQTLQSQEFFVSEQ